MKTFATIEGQDVYVTSVSMTLSSGYGQYNLNVQFNWNGRDFRLKIHSTDSVAYDQSRDADDSEEFLLDEFRATISDMVYDSVSEYIVKSEQDEEL